MDDLAERIKASLDNPNGELWFPELTADLAARAWNTLHRDIGVTSDSYSTERVLFGGLSAAREVVTFLQPRHSLCASTAPVIVVERLTSGSTIKYRAQGVSFYSADEILGTTILSCIEDALAIINQVPSLMRTIATLVQSLHVLKPEDADYDVSFSEPHVPFSVFVSVPEQRIANDSLRVAEAIVHEAMHLQLTLLEGTVPLVVSSSKLYYSPWRKEHRNSHGILHALYVFKVIGNFMKQLVSTIDNASGEAEYLRKRHCLTERQLESFRSFEHCTDLSRVGVSLVRALMRS